MLVTCIIINIVYVYYSISRGYFTFTWPLHLLRTCAKIFVTVLFLPMLEMMMTIFQCKHANGTLINIYTVDMECFKGVYFLHLTLAIIISLIFICICIIVSLTFFEIDDSEESSSSRYNI